MANQMTPAEMREAAGFAARQIPRDDIEAANLRTLAEAARCLAAVVETVEEARRTVHGRLALADDLRAVYRIEQNSEGNET